MTNVCNNIEGGYAHNIHNKQFKGLEGQPLWETCLQYDLLLCLKTIHQKNR